MKRLFCQQTIKKHFVPFLGKEQCSAQDFSWLEKLLSKMAEDRDSRVRIAAVRGLSTMAASGRLLSFSIYQQVKNVSFYKVAKYEVLFC